MITPANSNAAGKAANTYIDDASSSSSAFVLRNVTAALTASTNYQWYYHVIQ
jgi:hypothetical protein